MVPAVGVAGGRDVFGDETWDAAIVPSNDWKVLGRHDDNGRCKIHRDIRRVVTASSSPANSIFECDRIEGQQAAQERICVASCIVIQ